MVHRARGTSHPVYETGLGPAPLYGNCWQTIVVKGILINVLYVFIYNPVCTRYKAVVYNYYDIVYLSVSKF